MAGKNAEYTRMHINPDTGRIAMCKATTVEQCRFRDKDGKESPHFDNRAEAEKYVEEVALKIRRETGKILKGSELQREISKMIYGTKDQKMSRAEKIKQGVKEMLSHLRPDDKDFFDKHMLKIDEDAEFDLTPSRKGEQGAKKIIAKLQSIGEVLKGANKTVYLGWLKKARVIDSPSVMVLVDEEGEEHKVSFSDYSNTYRLQKAQEEDERKAAKYISKEIEKMTPEERSKPFKISVTASRHTSTFEYNPLGEIDKDRLNALMASLSDEQKDMITSTVQEPDLSVKEVESIFSKEEIRKSRILEKVPVIYTVHGYHTVQGQGDSDLAQVKYEPTSSRPEENIKGVLRTLSEASGDRGSKMKRSTINKIISSWENAVKQVALMSETPIVAIGRKEGEASIASTKTVVSKQALKKLARKKEFKERIPMKKRRKIDYKRLEEFLGTEEYKKLFNPTISVTTSVARG